MKAAAASRVVAQDLEIEQDAVAIGGGGELPSAHASCRRFTCCARFPRASAQLTRPPPSQQVHHACAEVTRVGIVSHRCRSQNQTLDKVLFDARVPAFSGGQQYVVCSRVRKRADFAAVVGDAKGWLTPGLPRTLVVANVVYTELLDALAACGGDDEPSAVTSRQAARAAGGEGGKRCGFSSMYLRLVGKGT